MPRRTSPTSLRAAVLVLGLGLALCGCLPADPPVTPPPTPDAEPVFASDEEALAAAEEAYGAYLATADAIAHDGGSDPDRISGLVTDERLVDELDSFGRLQSSGVHTAGNTRFTTHQLQQFEAASDGVRVSFYACWIGVDVRILDASGADVTPADRDAEISVEVVVVGNADELLLESDEPWSDDSFC